MRKRHTETSGPPSILLTTLKYARASLIVMLACVVLVPASAPVQIAALSQPNDNYASSNVGIENIQASYSVSGSGFDPQTGRCVDAVQFAGNAESMLTVDPRNASHLVGTSRFIYQVATSAPTLVSSSVGVHVSADGGHSWQEHVISGFDCATFGGDVAKPATIVSTADPVVAFDSYGNLYAVILPIFKGGYHQEGDFVPLYVAKSTDEGATWSVANIGKPVFSGGGPLADKPWITVDNNPSSPFLGTIYVVWAIIDERGNSGILISKSTDRGLSFTEPAFVSSPSERDFGYASPIPAVAPDGALYVSFLRYVKCPTPCNMSQVVLAKSTDGGMTFNPASPVAMVVDHKYPVETDFRPGIPYSFTLNSVNGHLLFALENATSRMRLGSDYFADNTDILIYESADAGRSWKEPLVVNDNPNEPTNQFQPIVAASSSGLVAVAFYDRRLDCPSAAGILLEDVGKKNVCIDTSIQFYNDQSSLSPIGRNIRVTKQTWDPNNGGSLGGNSTRLRFIGDYFGLAVTDNMAYPFFAANFDLDKNSGFNLQIFLARVSITKSTASTTTSTMYVVPATDAGTWIITIMAIAAILLAAGIFGFRRFVRNRTSGAADRRDSS